MDSGKNLPYGSIGLKGLSKEHASMVNIQANNSNKDLSNLKAHYLQRGISMPTGIDETPQEWQRKRVIMPAENNPESIYNMTPEIGPQGENIYNLGGNANTNDRPNSKGSLYGLDLKPRNK